MTQRDIDRFYEKVARRIADRRIAANPSLTQEALASRTPSLSRSAIANIESHRQRVALHQLVEIADALRMNVLDLLPGPDDEAAGGIPAEDPAAESFLKRLSPKAAGDPRKEEDDED